MRAILVLAALAVAAPAVAHAQDATERRRQQAFDNLRQLETNQRIGEVERQITNMEIRRQSEEALRALQAPAVAPQATYAVPGSSAATGVSPIQPSGERRYAPPGGSVAVNELPERVARGAATTGAPIPAWRPSVTPGILTPGLSGAPSEEDRLRDLELAASNARLREIAAAQRGQ